MHTQNNQISSYATSKRIARLSQPQANTKGSEKFLFFDWWHSKVSPTPASQKWLIASAV